MNFYTIEEIIADERFLAWYYKTDEIKAKEWTHELLMHQHNAPLVEQSIIWLNEQQMQEKNVPAAQIETAFQNFQSSLDTASVIEMQPGKKRWWIPAAVAVVVVSIAAFVYFNGLPAKTKLDSNFGKISEYQLPDGTQVLLNANSEITLNKKWEKDNDREVWLKGEAFFKVSKTGMKNKFIVHTNTMDIIVTGTQFNVVNRDDESSVLLTEGSVTLRTKDGKELHLRPGDFIKIENNIPEKKSADQEKVLAWKQAKLSFENTPMNEVAKIIARHYGVKVSISDKAIGEKTISGVMPNDNLDVLIEALEATGDYKISKSGNDLIISGS
ncbi:MAG: FecR family protein [Flavisolibacter sp.]